MDGTVLCLVTLTDLQTCRAGLSELAEFLVMYVYVNTLYIVMYCTVCHGSETWPMKVEHELKLNNTEMSMNRWMCGVKQN